MNLSYELVAGRIDHALLLPTLTFQEMEAGCMLAAQYQVASVCIKPCGVARAATILKGSGVAVGTTIGFPHGGQVLEIKSAEADRAMDDGATELDMVVNIGAVLEKRWDLVESEVGAVVSRAHDRGAIVKAIFENCYLDKIAIVQLSKICDELGVDYIKTSTGFGSGGATMSDLILMRASISKGTRLKAAGGIKDLATALEMIEIGCERLGTSRTVEILGELRQRLGLEPIGKAVPRETKTREDY